MRTGIIRLLLVPAVLCWLGCGAGEKVAGGGSDTPNAPAAFTGGVSISNGGMLAPDDVNATLYRVSSDSAGRPVWAAVDSVRTDADGRFKLESESSGTYTAVFSKAGYTAFSGYLDVDIPENDSVRVDMDTVVLTRSLQMIGQFPYLSKPTNIKVGLVGTGVNLRFNTMDNRAFVFDNVPLGNYRMSVILDAGSTTERAMVLPLPTAVGDTVYTENGFGLPTRVAVRSNTIELENSDVMMSCYVSIGGEQ